jgi:cbb3-type cytochrome oxidase subunit 3
MFFRPKKKDPFEEARKKMELKQKQEEERKRDSALLDH